MSNPCAYCSRQVQIKMQQKPDWVFRQYILQLTKAILTSSTFSSNAVPTRISRQRMMGTTQRKRGISALFTCCLSPVRILTEPTQSGSNCLGCGIGTWPSWSCWLPGFTWGQRASQEDSLEGETCSDSQAFRNWDMTGDMWRMIGDLLKVVYWNILYSPILKTMLDERGKCGRVCFGYQGGVLPHVLNPPMIASRVNCVGKIAWNPNISQPVGWCRMTIRQVCSRAPHRLLWPRETHFQHQFTLGDSTWLNHIAPYPERFSIRSYHTINMNHIETKQYSLTISVPYCWYVGTCWHHCRCCQCRAVFPRRCCSHPSQICWRWWTPRCSSAVLRNRPQSAGWFLFVRSSDWVILWWTNIAIENGHL